MSITTGTKLGRYEIRSKIGAGGMGEVYLAQDTKLDRKVALKILPAELAANQDRMRRFVQESKPQLPSTIRTSRTFMKSGRTMRRSNRAYYDWEERGIRPGRFAVLLAQQLVDELVFNEPANEVLLIKHTA